MRLVVVVLIVMFTPYCCYCQTNKTSLLNTNTTGNLIEFDSVNGTLIVNKNSSVPLFITETCSLTSSLNDTYYISCVINPKDSGLWDFDILRKWMSNSEYEFSFDIRCINFSEIILPWPMKASNLAYLKVEQCTILGWYNDFGNALLDAIPDCLRVLNIQNAVVLIRTDELLSFVTYFRNVTEEFYCVNENSIEHLTIKDITYKFNDDALEMLATEGEDDILANGGDIVAFSRFMEHSCVFKKLEVIDQSTSNLGSTYLLSMFTELSTFPQLQFYNLSYTAQKDIPHEFKTWWRIFPKLKKLDLSHNFISTIDLDSSSDVWSSYSLSIDLTHNNITKIKVSDLKLLEDLTNMFVNIKDNPLDCTCSEDFLEVLEIIQDFSKWKALKIDRYNYIKNMACYTPEGVKGRMLHEIQRNDLDCPVFVTSPPLAPIVTLSFIVAFLLFFLVILTKFRKEISILMYTRFHVLLPCQSTGTENKMYDAFISYSNKDEEWVSKTFKELEVYTSNHRNQLKFCLHHRDFIPGKTIFENVIDSVESSRHTVIILSRDFMDSHYCMYEFQEALQQSIMERKRHMIIVLMENIPEDELPANLKQCLKTFTYIRKDDSIFTDRLIYAIACKPKSVLRCYKLSINEGEEPKPFLPDKEKPVKDKNTNNCLDAEFIV